jgi:hypothetical protein
MSLKYCLASVLVAVMVSSVAYADHGPFNKSTKEASLHSKNNGLAASSANQTQAAGTYEDPKAWADDSYPLDIHYESGYGFYQSRFTGNAGRSRYYFPTTPGESNTYWDWRGEHAGTYKDPKNWNEVTRPGAIHYYKGVGYFASTFTGNAAHHNWYYPTVPGESNTLWTWKGAYAGTYADPKNWDELTYPGAIHHYKGVGYFASTFTGNAAHHNWYYPTVPGESNTHWTWKGVHAGTYADPKVWNELTYKGAIHGRGREDEASPGRYEAKFNGVAGSNYPNNDRDNEWWEVRALDCPRLDKSFDAQAENSSHFVTKQKFAPGSHIDMAALITQHTGKTSPLLKGLMPRHFSAWYKRGDREVSSAMLENEKSHEAGSISVVLKNDGSFYALLESPTFRGIVIGNSNGEQTLRPEKPYDYLKSDMVKPAHLTPVNHAYTTVGGDVDCNGTNVVEVLVGFSTAAADYAGDPISYALLQIESANLGLRNSRVDNVRLHLADIQIIPQDFPLNTETLAKVADLFKAGAERTKADLIAGYFITNGDAAGWAYVPGRYSVQHMHYPTAFRHEVGHNAGGSHCNTGENRYSFGYNNGTSRTFLCGNDVSYYSTPLLTDSTGKPLGNAQTADMARQWREKAILMSSYQKADPPFSGVVH